MSFFLIFLVTTSISFISVIGVAYLKYFYYVFFVSKAVSLIFDYRIKQNDKIIPFFLFIHVGFCVFAKDIFLHYYFIGKPFHSEHEFLEKLFVFCLTNIFVFSLGLKFSEKIYKNDAIRTVLYSGYGLSDALALNWISHSYINNTLDDWNYLFLMSVVNCIPGFFKLFKECLTLKPKKIVDSLKDARNIVTTCMVLAGINIGVLDHLRKTHNVYSIIAYAMINSVGMILYFGYKSYDFGKKYEEELMKKNEKQEIKSEMQKIEKTENTNDSKKKKKKKNE